MIRVWTPLWLLRAVSSTTGYDIFDRDLPLNMARLSPDCVRTSSGRAKISAMEPVATPSRRHRLEVRVTPEQDALIRQAADLEDTTVSAFVLETVTAKANRVVRDHRDVVLSNEAFDRFIAELDRPAEPVDELVDLFRRHPNLPEE